MFKMSNFFSVGAFVLLTLLLFSTSGFSQNKQVKETEMSEPLPKGDWSIVYHPYLGDDFQDAPVIVQSVSAKRLAAEKFEIQNISSKPVKSVYVKWLVYENQNRNKVLQQGRTKLLRFHDDLPSGVMGTVIMRVVSFADFYKNFLTNGQLNRSLDIDLLVDEVIFADGSTWKWEDGRSPDIKQEFVKDISQLQDCARQFCKPRPSTGVRGAVVYSCAASENNERCVPEGNFDCRNQSCIRPGNGNGEGPVIVLD